MKARLKPQEFEAVQWNKAGDHPRVETLTGSDGGLYGVLDTGDQPCLVYPGDWIVKGPARQKYHVQPVVVISDEDFRETYEETKE